jgi:hypothetical protein
MNPLDTPLDYQANHRTNIDAATAQALQALHQDVEGQSVETNDLTEFELGRVNVKKTIHNESEVNECGEHFIEFFES